MGADNLLLHYPPPFNHEYEREAINALGEWDLERRICELDREIDRLECDAWNAEGDLDFPKAERLVGEAGAKRAEYNRHKQQLNDMLSGDF